jgi:hypothetical protein
MTGKHKHNIQSGITALDESSLTSDYTILSNILRQLILAAVSAHTSLTSSAIGIAAASCRAGTTFVYDAIAVVVNPIATHFFGWRAGAAFLFALKRTGVADFAASTVCIAAATRWSCCALTAGTNLTCCAICIAAATCWCSLAYTS